MNVARLFVTALLSVGLVAFPLGARSATQPGATVRGAVQPNAAARSSSAAGVGYQVLATYTPGTLTGLIAANGFFYAAASVDSTCCNTNLLKLTPQGGITSSALTNPAGIDFYAPTVFVNNTLYGVGYCGTPVIAFCVDAIGDGRVRSVFAFPVYSGTLGYGPLLSLTYANGVFYDVNEYGGGNGYGTVFAVSASGAAEILHHFDQPYFTNYCAYGENFDAPTVAKVSGTLYGVVPTGGRHNLGFFYAIDLVNGAYRVLHSFGGRYDAACPVALINENGMLYGLSEAGEYSSGTLFAISPGGFSTVLHAFSLADAYPETVIAADGKLFGVSIGYPDAYSEPSVWEYSSTGYRVLHSFPQIIQANVNINAPRPQLMYLNGTLYGITPKYFFAITGV